MSKISFNPSELKVFKRAAAKDATVSNSSNPFGISFKGKVLNSDVFESSQVKDKVSFTSNIKTRSKLAASAIVGTVNSTKKFFSESISKVVESVGNFNNVVDNISKKMNTDVVELVKSIRFMKNKYNGKPVNELADKFKELNSGLAAV